MNFAQTIINQSLNYPDKIAYRDGTNDLTYRQLVTKIKQIAQGLNGLGLRKRDHVIILMEDCLDWPPTFLACVYLGIVPLAVSNAVPKKLLDKIANFIDCKLIISKGVPQKFYNLDGDIESVDIHPDAPGYMGLSSGTTGSPKIAVQRHALFFEILKLNPQNFDMHKDSIMLSAPKMSWGYGLHNSITLTLGLGATAILIPKPPSPTTLVRYINQYRPTIIAMSPAVIKKLVSTELTLADSIECFMSAGEDLPAALYDQFLEKFGIQIETAIGMLELSNILYCSTSKRDHAQGTLGKPFPGVEIKILQDNNICKTDQIGELHVKTPLATFYYYNNYQATKETFIGEWVKTGDLGYWDKNGNVVFVGRSNDMFKVKDLIVSPIEVEEEIEKITGVEEVAIVGINNEVHAFIVGNIDLETFKENISSNLFPHQIPKYIHLLDVLPKTVTGKKDRRQLSIDFSN